MSITKQLQTIADNVPKVYQAGYDDGAAAGGGGGGGGYDEGYADGQQDVLDAVNYELAGRDLETAETADDVSSALDNAFIEVSDVAYGYGKQAEYDAFWDAYQQNGNRNIYVDGFTREGWNEVTYNPKYPIVGGTYGFQSMYSNSGIVDTKVETILRGTGSLRATFNGCGYLKRIHSLVLEVPVTDAVNGFNNCKALEEINISCVGNGCIDADLNLSACSNLTNGSVDNILNALKDLTGQTAKTITFHKEMESKVTPDQKQAIDAKNWTQVY